MTTIIHVAFASLALVLTSCQAVSYVVFGNVMRYLSWDTEGRLWAKGKHSLSWLAFSAQHAHAAQVIARQVVALSEHTGPSFDCRHC